MANTQTIISNSPQETQKVGERLATSILNDRFLPRICCLYGELGAGKTVFTQGFAKGVGLPSRLVSPTFIIIKRYSLKNDTQYFYHVDLYRLQKIEDIENIGLFEIFNDKHAIVIVEWAERLEELIPDRKIDIRLTMTEETKRKIEIQYV